jgi:(2Fe-2S) ferredoxin
MMLWRHPQCAAQDVAGISERDTSDRATEMSTVRRVVVDTSRHSNQPLAMRRHLFVCTNARGSGKPTCGPTGGDEIAAEVQRLVIERGAIEVLVTPCGCLGPCFDGPNAVIYPDGVWYSALVLDDAPGLVDHLIDGTILDAKRRDAPG